MSEDPLYKYVTLAQSAQGAAAIMNIERCLKDKAVFFVGELLQQPHVLALRDTPAHAKHFHLLELFAHGTFVTWKNNRAKFPPIDPQVTRKLKMLTVVSMAADSKFLDYAHLMRTLDIDGVRALEDLLIECIYAGLIVGRLDQQLSQVQIQSALGRDVSDLDINNMCDKLEQWSLICDQMISSVDASAKQSAETFELERARKLELQDRLTKLKQEKQAAMGESRVRNSRGGGGGGGGEAGDAYRRHQAEEAELARALEISRADQGGYK